MAHKSLFIICQRLPYPPRRGDQLAVSKMIEFCHQKKIRVEVAICSSFNRGAIPLHLQDTVIFSKLEYSFISLVINFIKNPLDPLQVQLFSGYKLKKYDNNIFPVVYLHTVRMTRLIENCVIPSSFLGAQIDFAKEFRERASGNFGVMGLIYSLESWLLCRFQSHILNKFRLVFRVTEEEFVDYKLENIKTFPHGIDPARVLLSGKVNTVVSNSGSELKIGLWGNFEFGPNIEAYENLLKWKMFSKRSDKILIFGRGSSNLVSSQNDVEILGEVEDLDLYIDQCDVAVNLVETGGGFQNKTIEAWARGIPVVGFWQAFRGLMDVDHIKIMVQDIEDIDRALDVLTKEDPRTKDTCNWLLNNWNQTTLTEEKLTKMGLS